jgi:hypothetical protein
VSLFEVGAEFLGNRLPKIGLRRVTEDAHLEQAWVSCTTVGKEEDLGVLATWARYDADDVDGLRLFSRGFASNAGHLEDIHLRHAAPRVQQLCLARRTDGL